MENEPSKTILVKLFFIDYFRIKILAMIVGETEILGGCERAESGSAQHVLYTRSKLLRNRFN